MKISIIILTTLSLAVCGCATMFRGSGNQDVHFTTSPSGASIEIQAGASCNSTPCVIPMERKSRIATVSRPGCQTSEVSVDTSIVGMTWLNILFWPGFIVDVATGAIHNVEDTHINLNCS